MGKDAMVLLFSIMIFGSQAQFGQGLSLACRLSEYLCDIKEIREALQGCHENCTNATKQVDPKCCPQVNVSSADMCNPDYFLKELESLKSFSVDVDIYATLLIRRLNELRLYFDKVELTCERPKVFLDQLIKLFQKLHGYRSAI